MTEIDQIRPSMHPRRWPRFTLRVLLVAITAVCIGLAVWTHRAREQGRLVARIVATGGSVTYDFDSARRPRGGARRTFIPQVLRDWLGVDYFHEVTYVETFDCSVLSDLHRFGQLEALLIANRELTDEQLVPLAQLRGLLAL